MLLRALQPVDHRGAGEIQAISEEVARGDNFHEEERRRNKPIQRPDSLNGRLLLVEDRDNETVDGGPARVELEPEQNVREVREGREGGQQVAEQV